MRIFILCFLFLTSIPVFSQEYPVVEEHGEKYYLYQVQPGNTLYGISKGFLISTGDILKTNPELAEGLKAGQTIRIPISKENKKLQKKDAPVLQNNQLLHTIQKGETLYAIAKKYNVTQEQILRKNPQSEMGLKVGEIIKIPLLPTPGQAPDTLAQSEWITHTVRKGETLYSLARQYNVNIDSISIINNGLPQGLQEGQVIYIPIKRVSDGGVQSPDSIYGFIRDLFRRDSLRTGPRKIALLLPFFTEMNRNAGTNSQGIPEVYPQSQVAVSFYNGFKMAMDSLWTYDSLQVYVFDTGNDSLSITRILRKPEMKTMDLIVGPLYASYFPVVARFAGQNNIPVISPFSQTEGLADINPWVIKLTMSNEQMISALANTIDSVYQQGVNYILINPNTPADLKLVESFRKNAALHIKWKEVDIATGGVKAIQALLDPVRENVLIFPSRDKAKVTDLLTKLNFIENRSMTVIGTDHWIDYENIDTEYFERLKVTLPVAGYIDYNSEDVVSIVSAYRTKFGLEADPFSIRGFDIAKLSYNILNGGYRDSESINVPGMYVNYRLVRKGDGKGIVNNSMKLIRFENYRFVPVNE